MMLVAKAIIGKNTLTHSHEQNYKEYFHLEELPAEAQYPETPVS